MILEAVGNAAMKLNAKDTDIYAIQRVMAVKNVLV